MNYEAFVYKWTNLENGMYYIGKHKGTDNDGYISSGKSFLNEYHNRPESFVREIIFRGTDKDCLNKEQNLIKQAVRLDGYQKLYNQTGWLLLKEWKRTCTHCGSIVDPRNEVWLESFTKHHFENCKSINTKQERKQKQLENDYTVKGLTIRIGKLLYDNTKENGFKHQDEIRRLRKLKTKLLKTQPWLSAI